MSLQHIQSERDIETKIIYPLFNETLGYPDTDLHADFPVTVTLGRQKTTKRADLVAFCNGKPVIVIEAKKPTQTLQFGIDQVDSYAFALKTRYSVITNGHQFILRGYYSFNNRINIIEEGIEEPKKDKWRKLKELISRANILSSISDKPNETAAPDEEKIKDYRRFFRSIHTIIRDGDKLDPAASFDEMSKILFLKAAEDEWMKKRGGQTVLTLEKIEEWEHLGKGREYIDSWFVNAIKEFSDVFEENSKINLSIESLKKVLKYTQSFHVRNGDVDVKGRAFEEFLPTQLRGKGLGQFFTPRPIVNFMVDLAEISIHDVVVDFACGSGGFLIKAFERVQQLVDSLPDGIWKRLGIKKDDFINDVKEHQLHGIDAEPRAARTAKMNMLMWGDGRCVVRGNALDIIDFNGKPYNPLEYISNDKHSGCSVILANPPFGSAEKNPEILCRYNLGSKLIARTTQKTEILFLEKAMKLLRPQGRMLIVIPQGILSNESYDYVRDFLHSETEIRAIITLPTHTFVQSGVQTVKTCVLYVQKFSEEKKRLYDEKTNGKTPQEIREFIRSDIEFDYSIFMGTAEFVGYEPSGRPNVRTDEKTDLDLLLKEFINQQEISKPDINLIEFAKVHYDEKPLRRIEQTIRGSQKGLKTSFVVKLSGTEDRLDPPFYLLRYQAGALLQTFSPLDIEEYSKRFRPVSDEEMDAEYPILSVTNDGKVSLSHYLKGEDFTQSYKQVRAGDIVYNPYRVNIGSIGVVSAELESAYVSPAYVVFRSLNYEPQFLVDLLRSPFGKMYLDIISTGSIRDSVSFDLLQTLRIPEITKNEQEKMVSQIRSAEQAIERLFTDIDVQKEQIIDKIHKTFIPPEDEKPDL